MFLLPIFVWITQSRAFAKSSRLDQRLKARRAVSAVDRQHKEAAAAAIGQRTPMTLGALQTASKIQSRTKSEQEADKLLRTSKI